MKLSIYNKHNQLRFIVEASDNSTNQSRLMSDNVLNVSFILPEYHTLDVNDYIDYDGERFWLLEAHKPQHKSNIEWNYACNFYGLQSLIKRALMLKLTDGELLSEFSLTAPVKEHLQFTVDNINRVMNTTEFKIGECIASENLTIDYNGTYCHEALAKQAEAAETEWWFDGTTINMSRCEHGNEITLGYRNGLTSLNRGTAENVKFFTRLFPLGSTRNIDPTKYGHPRLQLPEGKKYVEQNIDQYGIIEHTEETTFSNIYPKRIGKISSVRAVENNGEGNKKNTVYYFTDNELNFNPNEYNIPGQVKHIVFQSGELNGRDFEVNFNASTKEFQLVNQFPYGNDMQLPGGQLIPKINDTYILWNLKMPQEYIIAAENEFAEAVSDYIAKNSIDKSVYKANTDYVNIQQRGIKLTIGQRVRLESPTYFPETGNRLSRIISITRKINNPNEMDIEMSDVIGKGKISTIENDIKNIYHLVKTSQTELPEIIKSWQTTDPTDYNLLSALRVLIEISTRAVSRLNDDTASGIIRFLKGIVFGEDGTRIMTDPLTGKTLAELGEVASDLIRSNEFSEGVLGSGFVIRRNPETGKSYIEVDELFVRMKAYFVELMIEKISHVGGQILLTPARMKCTRVDELADCYRCYFEQTDGDKKITNDFVIGDQARYQTFNIKEGVNYDVSNQYYWRLVIGKGDNYIDLSKTDCDSGSTVPQTGDEIVQLGNRSDISRQNAIILSSFGADSPSIKQYSGINSYSLSGKEVTVLSTSGNKFKGDFQLSTGEDITSALNDIKTSLSTEISAVPGAIKAAISDVKIGGRNLLKNSGNWKENGWNDGICSFGGGYDIDSDVTFNGMSTICTHVGHGLTHPYLYLENGVEYTYSAMVRCNEDVIGDGSTPLHYHAGLNCTHEHKITVLKHDTSVVANVWKQIYIVFKLTDDANSFRPFFYRGANGTTKYWLAYIKLEKGNKPTDWTPAPEDVKANAQQLANQAAYAVKEETKSEIEVLAGQVSSKVGKIEFDVLGQKVRTVESEITQLPDKITLGLNIGGRNLLNNSGNWQEDGWNNGVCNNGGGYGIDPNVKYNGMSCIETFVGSGVRHSWIKLQNNVEYTYSAMVYCNESIVGYHSSPLHYHAGYNEQSENKIQVLKYDTSVVANTWKLIYIVFKLTDNANTFRPFFYRGANGTTKYSIAYMKLERGNKPTDWSPSPEDVEANTDNRINHLTNQLAQTGIEIENKKITLTADKTLIQDNSGNPTALFENGKIKASVIDVDNLYAKHLAAVDGTVGDLEIIGGEIIGKLEDKTRIRITRNPIATLSELDNVYSRQIFYDEIFGKDFRVYYYSGGHSGGSEYKLYEDVYTKSKPFSLEAGCIISVKAKFREEFYTDHVTGDFNYISLVKITDNNPEVLIQSYAARKPSGDYQFEVPNSGDYMFIVSYTARLSYISTMMNPLLRIEEFGEIEGTGRIEAWLEAHATFSQQCTLIGSDGFYSYWGPNDYFYAKKNSNGELDIKMRGNISILDRSGKEVYNKK